MSEEAFRSGRLDAERDVGAGKLVIRLSGRPAHWVQWWAEILKRDCGVEITNGGCLVSEEMFSYDDGYNEVSQAEMRRRFGEDVLERTMAEAELAAASGKPPAWTKLVNNNPEMEAAANRYGWVKCPHCGVSFKPASADSWDGQMHVTCKQKIRLKNYEG